MRKDRFGVGKAWLPGRGDSPNYEHTIPLLRNKPKSAGMRKRERDRAEALRLTGGPKPSVRDRAIVLARDCGVVRTCELTDIGIPRCYLARMRAEELLEKVGYGRYRAAKHKVARKRA